MASIKRLLHNGIGESPVCTAGAIIRPRFREEDFVLACGVPLLFTQVQTNEQFQQVLGAPVVLADATPVGTVAFAERLIGVGLASKAAVLIRITSPAPAGLPRYTVDGIADPRIDDAVSLERTDGGRVNGRVVAVGVQHQPVLDGRTVVDGFTIALEGSTQLTAEDSGAIVLWHDRFVGMYVGAMDGGLFFCTKAANIVGGM
jgi:hypothetical protein